jgi:hypothetical protein
MSAASNTPQTAASPTDGVALARAYQEEDTHGLRALLGLAAMAVEAGRVVRELELLHPDRACVQETMRLVPCWREWTQHEGSLGGALVYMQNIAGRMVDRMNVVA